MSVAFVDEHRAQFGVEFICKVLQVAPSSYYAAKKRQAAPSARAVRDVVMMQVVFALWIANRKVYGAHKLWKAARRAGHDIGRDQVARLMRQLSIAGVSRLRKKVFTTQADPDATRARDLVNRQFKADRPDALWVTDLTYVPTLYVPAMDAIRLSLRTAWLGWLLILFLVIAGLIALFGEKAPASSFPDDDGEVACEINSVTGVEECYKVDN